MTDPSTDDPLPHHEVTGLFVLKGPKKRTVLVSPEEFEIEMLRTLEVHSSTLSRLFNEGLPTYAEDPCEGTFPWGRRYPKKVADALADVDGSLVRLHVLLARPASASAADWHSLGDFSAAEVLKKVQQAREAVATWNPRDPDSPLPDKSFVQNIATLLAFKQQALCLELVERVAAAPRTGPDARHINAMRKLQADFHKLTTTVRHAGEVQAFLDELDKALT